MPDFVSSPGNATTPLPSSPRSTSSQQPEPLLSLLTATHPLLAKTIEGTTSAYNSSKNFSPRFKSGAEYVEGYLTPIGNTLGSVGRVTGVEGGVRWFLGAGRRHQHPSSDLESGNGVSNKRRKVAGNAEEGGMDTVQPADADPFGFTKDRRLSMSTIDTLPAYDDHKSPAYTETFDGQAQEQVRADVGLVSPGPVAWQSRLMMSTSGLSIAMSDESLRRLKYCLRLLRWANEHIAKVISALQAALDQLERPRRDRAAGSSPADEKRDADTGGQADDTSEPEPDRGAIAARISALKGDVVKTLINAIQTVSKYAGGALPENARDLVRRHLTSLPDRFRLATQATPAQADRGQSQLSKDTEGARRVLVLAKEGLEMLAQVSGVLDGTIVSAEEWCERLGKKSREESQQPPSNSTESTPSAAHGEALQQ